VFWKSNKNTDNLDAETFTHAQPPVNGKVKLETDLFA
jgi:hypothetical protein